MQNIRHDIPVINNIALNIKHKITTYTLRVVISYAKQFVYIIKNSGFLNKLLYMWTGITINVLFCIIL